MTKSVCHCIGLRVLEMFLAVLAVGLLPVAAMGTHCEIETVGTLAFGTITLPAASPTYADTEISVTCDNGVPYTIGISGTEGIPGRAMTVIGNSSFRLPYELYMDSSLRKPWGEGDQEHSPKKSDMGSGTTKHHYIYGEARPSDQTGVGTYSDELLITIEW